MPGEGKPVVAHAGVENQVGNMAVGTAEVEIELIYARAADLSL